jgi:hypothetical protein
MALAAASPVASRYAVVGVVVVLAPDLLEGAPGEVGGVGGTLPAGEHRGDLLR